MSFLIPPINARGFYSLKAPWSTAPNTIYECIAIREVYDFTQIGTDPFELIYQPQSIERSVYDADVAAGVKILTLRSNTRPTLYVPNSYLLGFPSNDNVAYNHIVASISLGAIPDALDLTFLQDQLASATEATIGVTPEVKIHAAPSDTYVSADQHNTLEQARQDAITNMKTDRARLLEANHLIDELRQVIARYEEIMREHDLIPE